MAFPGKADPVLKVGKQPAVCETEYVGPAVTTVCATTAFGCLAGNCEGLGVLRQQSGCLDADVVEAAGELTFEPGGERRGPVVESAGQGLCVQADLVAQAGPRALELDSAGGGHRVDRLAERVQPSDV